MNHKFISVKTVIWVSLYWNILHHNPNTQWSFKLDIWIWKNFHRWHYPYFWDTNKSVKENLNYIRYNLFYSKPLQKKRLRVTPSKDKDSRSTRLFFKPKGIIVLVGSSKIMINYSTKILHILRLRRKFLKLLGTDILQINNLRYFYRPKHRLEFWEGYRREKEYTFFRDFNARVEKYEKKDKSLFLALNQFV